MWLALETRASARLWLLGKITGLLLLPGALALIPTAWLETHHSLCLIRALTGKSCPGCGMSRAISCALHGEYTRAWRLNQLVVIVLPLLGYAWLRALASDMHRLHTIQLGSDQGSDPRKEYSRRGPHKIAQPSPGKTEVPTTG